MLFYTSSKDHCHGKDFQVVLRLKNMLTLRKRRRRSPLKNYAGDNQMSSKNSYIIVEVLVLHKTLIMTTLSACSRLA